MIDLTLFFIGVFVGTGLTLLIMYFLHGTKHIGE